MSFGDVGGLVTELCITCMTKETGEVNIKKGDPVRLCGNYMVTNRGCDFDRVFGQAMADCDKNACAIPVRVRGVCKFMNHSQYRAGVGDSVCMDGDTILFSVDPNPSIVLSDNGDGTVNVLL